MRAAVLTILAMTAQPLVSQVPPLGSAAGMGVEPSRVLVMPFENVTRDSTIVWMGEAAAVLIADDLNARGTPAISRDERRQAFDKLQVPTAASLSDATIIRIGQIVGASQVIVGSLERSGESLVVRARSIALETGRLQATAIESGPAADLFVTFERIARRLMPQSHDRGEGRERPSLAAFESYIKGLLAETPANQINYLTAALKLQPTLDRARLALWEVFEEEGEHERALAAVRPVPADSPWGRRARFRVGLSQLNLGRTAEAFETFTALAATQPSADVLNNLGVVQLRRGVTTQGANASSYFTKAIKSDPEDGDSFFNLGYASWVTRDVQAAIYWLRETVRRNPTDGDAHFVLGAALAAAGNGPEALREKELAKRLSSTYGEWDKRPPAEVVPPGLERLKGDVELPHTHRIEATLATNERRDQQELAQFYLDRGRRLFEIENDRDAVVELERALYLSPYQPQAHLLLGRIHMRNGSIHDAIDALKISLWSDETPEAHVALGEAYLLNKETDAARSEAERALEMDPSSVQAKQLLEKTGPKSK